MAKEGQVGNYSSWHYFHFLFLFLLFFSCFFPSLSLSLSLPLSPSPCHTLVPHFPLVGSPSSGCRSHCLRKVGIFRAAVRSCFLFFLSFLLADLSRSCGVLWLTGGDEISIFFFLCTPLRLPTYSCRHTSVHTRVHTSYRARVPYILSDAPNKRFLWWSSSCRVSWIIKSHSYPPCPYTHTHTHLSFVPSPLSHSLIIAWWSTSTIFQDSIHPRREKSG